MAAAPGTPSPGTANIAAARRRSTDHGLDPSATEIPHVGAPGPTADALLRLSTPVLDHLLTQITDSSVGLVLADRAGRLTKRDAGARSTLDAMDDRSLDVGFSLAESDVGTNGVGTSLETKRPAVVVGGDHFLECFHPFTCANAPIIHPISRKVVGTVGVLCPVEDTGPLLLPTAVQLSTRIAELLLEHATPEERTLLQHFLARRRHHRTPIATLGRESLIATPTAQRLLAGIDHAELWSVVEARVRDGRPFEAELEHPAGAPLLLRCEPLVRDGSFTGATVEISVEGPTVDGRRAARRPKRLGDLVGTSDQWTATVDEALLAVHRQEPVLITGERGTGRSAVAGAIARLGPGETTGVFDSADLLVEGDRAWLLGVRDALQTGGVVVLRHIDRLPDRVAAALAPGVAAADDTRVIATAESARSDSSPGVAALLDQVNVLAVDVAPLRQRRQDIAPLATHFAARLGRQTLDPAVLNVLHRQPWPGNVIELKQAVRSAHARARTQPLTVQHLPRHLRQAQSRAPLVGLRQSEADAIMAAINNSATRAEAAEQLGISRATLFRRIKAYGLDVDGG
ncbi:MAG: helix-turn-helix domain-containing protein [Actinomycetota bacterium]